MSVVPASNFDRIKSHEISIKAVTVVYFKKSSHHDLGGISAVHSDCTGDELQCPGVDLVLSRDVTKVLVAYVNLHHRHPVGGEGPGFIRADSCSVTHSLTGIQVTHQVVVLHHFLW